MAENLPINFPVIAEASITSYSFTETATKTGYIEFHCVKTNEGSYLMANPIGSNYNDIYTIGTGATVENNFDVQFKAPQDIGGLAFVRGNMLLTTSSTASTGYVQVRAYHVRGVTETAISSQITSDTFSTGAAGGLVSVEFPFTVALTLTNTHFQIDDYLRLEIIFTGAGGGGTFSQRLYHDPEEVGGLTNSEDLRFEVPFRIYQ